MNKTIIALSAILIITGGIVTSCTEPAGKVTTVETTTTTSEPSPEAIKANQDYVADLEAYRRANAERIVANEKSLADFKASIAQDVEANKAEDRKKLAELEQKNADLKKKLDEYKADSKENLDAFKAAFDRDLEGVGEGVKVITIKTVK